MLRAWLARVAVLFRRSRGEDLDEEIRIHLRMAVDENRRRGMSPKDALRAARLSFGSVDGTIEACRDQRGVPLIESILQDVRLALRNLLTRPGFSLTVVITLGLGIGATALMFSVVKAVLIEPLPYPDPHQLVWGWGQFEGGDRSSVSPADFLDYRAETRSFAEFSASTTFSQSMNLVGGDRPERVRVAFVTANYFDVLQVAPAIGRTFEARHEDETSASVAVLSYGLWQRVFGGAPDAIGETIRVGGNVLTIVGVMPAGISLPRGAEMWAPIPFGNPVYRSRDARFLRPIGRLCPDVVLAQAQEDADVVARRLEREYPNSNSGTRLQLQPLRDVLLGNVGPNLLILMTAVGFLWLIACVNVVNLVLARGMARRREIATRIALGAGRVRLLRLLIVEHTLLALAGGVAGILLAGGGVRTLVVIDPGNVPRLSETVVDMTVLGFVLALSAIAVLIFGLLPALRTAHVSGKEALNPDRLATRRYHPRRVARSLVVAEIAASLVLVIGSGLLIRSFANMLAVEPGFTTERALTLQLNVPASSEPASRRTFFQEVVADTERLPGVTAAGLVSELPLALQYNDLFFHVDGQPPESPAQRVVANYRRVTPGYFRAMEIPLRRGRLPTWSEVDQRAPVALIDERLADQFFADEDPISRGVVVEFGEPLALQIVGVVGSIRDGSWRRDPYQTIYAPDIETPLSMTLVARTSGPPGELANAMRNVVTAIDPDQPVSNIATLADATAGEFARPRFRTLLLGGVSALGAVLTALGLYGVITFATTRRTGEIGLRMALGARRGHMLAFVVSDGLRLTAVGVAMGLAAAYGLVRFLGATLFGVAPHDAVTFVVAPLLLIAVSTVATLVPALRAARIDPAHALRHE